MEKFKYKYDDLFESTITALRNLGGSASVSEMEEEVVKILKLTEEEILDIHRGNVTKLTYRLAWARTHLKWYGLIENSSRSVWILTDAGINIKTIDKREIKRKANKLYQESKKVRGDIEADGDEEGIPELNWQSELLEVIQNIPPDKFERLCQRMLREAGFANVEVTGKSGDGGIDGKGIIIIAGLLSFHVVFQCKRFKGSVSPSFIRDFRGAMEGRADKGLFITTGIFTRDAKIEAQRDGATPIDLIDGFLFVEKLKELGLGANVKPLEKVTVNKEWFNEI